jgi:hypothetical protein
MNKVITDGLALMPPAFASGLSVWSRTDGTAGSPGHTRDLAMWRWCPPIRTLAVVLKC